MCSETERNVRRRSDDRTAAGRARTGRSTRGPAWCAVLAALLLCVGGRDVHAGGGSFLPGVGLWGWLISATYVAEEPFTDDQVKAIRHGVTTKQDILAWFGPPLAIARPGSVVKVPRPVIHQAGSDDVPSDDLFRRFVPGTAFDADTVVYYYHCLTAKQLVEFPIPMSFELSAASPYGEYAVSAKMLWILIDQRTGIVVDHRLEQAEGTESQGRFIPKPAEDIGGPAGEESHVPWQK